MSNHVLIPAAGAGSRMGGTVPKQYLPLLDKPLIHHTLSVFNEHPCVHGLAVVISPEDGWWDTYDWSAFGDRLTVLRCGGETRAASVLNGLKAMEWDDEDWVLVHDAARPCITATLLDRLFDELREDEVGGLLAVPVADTLKRAGVGQRVASTEPRESLWQAQTPQMFHYGLLKRALESFGSNMPTDEAQAVERLGFAPKLILGERNNLKVTFPEDLDMAGMLLQARRQL
ncbi:2-C-methyl-D-erythritol 4-phosphate cytidylyltransferase [Novimethylophilus kurashikiensis]|uniref:2-C-methyl-D-erythritol 4-phosphate cytidylyltransferase n=1 Tax=Novimethylophilus kurashikiensis TaxID=1825523 RepID=UPI000D59C02E|nr:2-C-methyl-D-erythritol 4-phosphate cytidylyltransferase [Novimethylophilus kurashikiensis]